MPTTSPAKTVHAVAPGLYEGLCRAAESEPGLVMHHHRRVVEVGRDRHTVRARTDGGRHFVADLMADADGHAAWSDGPRPPSTRIPPPLVPPRPARSQTTRTGWRTTASKR